MPEVHVIIHQQVLETWLSWEQPFLTRLGITRTLARIYAVRKSATRTPPITIVDFSISDNFDLLPARVGRGNTARLYGARRTYCVRKAQCILEAHGIRTAIDEKGTWD
jgi:hypothetical protein